MKKKKRKASRFLAVMMTMVMGLTMTPVFSYADHTTSTDETKNVLVFGDSTSSGYGLPDFSFGQNGFNIRNNDLYDEVDNPEGTWRYESLSGKGKISVYAHPWQLKKYIARKEFGGDLKKVDLSSMCLAGMRTDELRALLEPAYYDSIHEQEERLTRVNYEDGTPRHIGFLTEHMEEYVNSLRIGGATIEVDGQSKPVETLADAQAYTRTEVQNANVIVVDVCTNNFGTYLARRIAGSMPGGPVPGFEAEQRYNNQKVDDIEDLSADTKAKIKVFRNLLRDRLIPDSVYSDMLLDSLAYCYACCLTNFTRDMELLRQLNPDAKIVAVGIYNSLSGTKLRLNGQDFNLGDIGDVAFGTVNTYIQALEKNSDYYYYADLGSGLESFVEQISRAGSVEELLDPEKGATEDTIEVMNNLFSSDNSLCDIFLDGRRDLTEEQTYRAMSLIYESAKIDTADLGKLMENLGTIDACREEIRSYIMDGSAAEGQQGVEPSAEAMALLHIYDRFLLDYGMGQHPSKKGCNQKAAAVIKAYDSTTPAYTGFKQGLQEQLEELQKQLEGTRAGDSLADAVSKINTIYAALEMLEESGLTPDQMRQFLAVKDQLVQSIDEVLNQMGTSLEELWAKALDVSSDPEAIRKIADQIRTLRDLIPLLPTGEQLQTMAEAVRDLQEFEKLMDEYMEKSNAAIAELEGRANALERRTDQLQAKFIKVDLSAEVSFPAGTVKASLRWRVDPDADGYRLTRNGKEVEYAEEDDIMTFEDPGVKIGKTCVYEVTPYVYGVDGEMVMGKTFRKSVEPRVDLAKGKIRKVKTGRTTLKASWEKVPRADGYQLSCRTSKKAAVKTFRSAGKLSVTVKGLKANKKYTVKVRACKTVNNVKYFGAWSKPKYVKTK